MKTSDYKNKNELWPDLATARFFLRQFIPAQSESVEYAFVLPETVPEEQLLLWIKKNELGPWLYGLCCQGQTAKSSLKSTLTEDWYAAFAENELHAKNLAFLYEIFGRKNIPLVLLKGAALKLSVYSDPVYRVMSDVDLWVMPDNMLPIVNIMIEKGYQVHQKDIRPIRLQKMVGGEVQLSHKNWQNCAVELHWQPLKGWWLARTAKVDTAAVYARIETIIPVKFQNWIKSRATVYQLSPEDMVLHLAVHLAVNHQFGLTAVRHLLDIALTARVRGVDWQVVADRARDWRVATAVYVVLDLLNSILGAEGIEPALRQIRPSKIRRIFIQQYVSPKTILENRDVRSSRRRFLLLFLLVDRFRDMVHLLFRTFWPEPAWLEARYGRKKNHFKHLWNIMRHGQV